jgi:hypothetical protein
MNQTTATTATKTATTIGRTTPRRRCQRRSRLWGGLALLLGLGAPAWAEAPEQTCGQEMAASAEVPAEWQALMDHVAGNMEWHARWAAAAGSPAGRREHDAMARVARAYRAMAAAAGRAAIAMKAMKDLPPVAHDRSQLDRPGLARWMRAKIKMQREFAATLNRHAADSEKALAELEAPAGP